jgi:hypothetical protein
MKPSDSSSGHVETAHAVGRGDHGNAGAVHQFGQLAPGFRQRHAVADEEDGLVGRADHRDRGGDFLRRRAAPVRVQRRGRGRQLELVLLLEHVEWHVDVHRPRPARHHEARCLAQRERQHVDAGRLKTALDHRPDDAREVRLVMAVDLLERAAVELRCRHVGGDRHQGGGIAQRHRERHHDVARARPARSERRDRFVAHAEVGVRHMGGDLLVARRDEFDSVAHVVERIEQPDVAMTA